MTSLLVADAGPLIALAVAKALPQAATHLRLLVPQAVLDECLADLAAPGAETILQLHRSKQFEVIAKNAIEPLDAAYAQGLGTGEVAVLSYAAKHGLTALIDERRARAVAQRLQVSVVGSGAVLLELKKAGLLPSVAQALDAWSRHSYHLSPVLRAALLLRAGEGDK